MTDASSSRERGGGPSGRERDGVPSGRERGGGPSGRERGGGPSGRERGGRTLVVKVGTSSLTDARGVIRRAAIDKLGEEIAGARAGGHRVVVVTSGAIAAGLPVLGLEQTRPTSAAVLQAASAVGQSRLLGDYDRALANHGLVGGQILLSPPDFFDRRRYLLARRTVEVLLELGVVPIVNENDAIAEDEIRWGDNDRLAALVAHLVGADLLLLLTDTPGLLSSHPDSGTPATLVEEVLAFDHDVEAMAGGSGSGRGSGGMASKLAAAKMAAWSGVGVVIASAERDRVLADAIAGRSGVGTFVVPRNVRLGARRLWIAFATGAGGRVLVDAGARQALLASGVSLLPAGVVGVEGSFDADAAVEIAGPDGVTFAKGLVRHPAEAVRAWAGRQTSALPAEVDHEIVHRDDLVLLPG